LAAVTLALSALTRPISQFLPLALWPVFGLAYSSARWQSAVIRTIGFVLVSQLLLSVWACRNYGETGLWTLSTIGEHNLIYYRARDVVAEVEHISRQEASDQLQAKIVQDTSAHKLTAAQIVTLERREALAIFAHYPIATLEMHGKGFLRIFAQPGYDVICKLLSPVDDAPECYSETGTAERVDLLEKFIGKFGPMNPLQLSVSIWGTLLLGLTYASAAGGGILLIRRRQWFALTLFLLVIPYFALLSSGAESTSRFRIPILPIFAILAGIGGDGFITHYLSRT
jgi:hypothetical protein